MVREAFERMSPAVDMDDGWAEPEKPPRDIKKLLLIIGLGALSWVATYVGMLELIQANMGELPFSTQFVVGCSVAMLMLMIIWLLDQMFAPLPLFTKLAYVAGYVFLTMISVGFGFGFYWKVLESRTEASRSAESAVTQVQGSLVAAAARLDQLQTTLDDLTRISNEKAIEERERGTSCPNSRPGDGPRRRLRDADAARFSYASGFVQGRLAKIKDELTALDGSLLKITSGDPSTIDPETGTRNAYMRSLSNKLELTTSRFNAFKTDPQLLQIRQELDRRSTTTIFPTDNGGTFSCPDPQLQAALRGVVVAIDQLPELQKPYIATVEGSEAVIEAFRRLGATFQGIVLFELPPSADELRELQKEAVRRAEASGDIEPVVTSQQGGLSKRDYIPLAIAIFVDLCLLLVSIGRPVNRMDGLIPRMRQAERGPVYQILSKFSEIHADEEVRRKFEVFRHVVFDFNGDYYVAVPLDSPRRKSPDEVKRLQQEAHLLSNLFASFEKEKIFARVINPLLGTRTIQKKLRRQGSDFADAGAFRVYRFKDGAWSEIILGAIMGASRRARAERRIEQSVRALEGGSLNYGLEDASGEDLRTSGPADYATNKPDGRNIAIDPAHARRFGPYAVSAALEQYASSFRDAEGEAPDQNNAYNATREAAGHKPRRERIADRLRRIREATRPPEEADVSIRSREAEPQQDTVANEAADQEETGVRQERVAKPAPNDREERQTSSDAKVASELANALGEIADGHARKPEARVRLRERELEWSMPVAETKIEAGLRPSRFTEAITLDEPVRLEAEERRAGEEPGSVVGSEIDADLASDEQFLIPFEQTSSRLGKGVVNGKHGFADDQSFLRRFAPGNRSNSGKQ